MHRPPAVSCSVGRSLCHLGLVLGLWLVAAVACGMLAYSLHSLSYQLLLALVLVIAGAIALWGWRKAVTGRLQWDGEHWLWTEFGDAAIQRMSIVLDFQRLLLLRVESEGGAVQWLWLESKASDRSWRALRRAVIGIGASP